MRRSTGWRACWRAASSRSTSLRRLVRASVEDIGLADPQAVVQAIAAKDVYDFLGSPEGEIALVQCVLYLASAPKSNAVYVAHGAAMRAAEEHGSLMPPAHILNAPTKLMKNLGYGKGYEYDHEAEEGFSGQNYFPDGMARQHFYQPKETGFEREIAEAARLLGQITGQEESGVIAPAKGVPPGVRSPVVPQMSPRPRVLAPALGTFLLGYKTDGYSTLSVQGEAPNYFSSAKGAPMGLLRRRIAQTLPIGCLGAVLLCRRIEPIGGGIAHRRFGRLPTPNCGF